MKSSRPSNRRLTTALVCVVSLIACSRDDNWQERWTILDDASTESSRATFGLTWLNDERTRGEYGFTFALPNTGEANATGSWRGRGTFTAEHSRPDYCGRAKWSAGSTCVVLTLWPRGTSPAGEVQHALDALGLPDRQVRTYFVFEDGRSKTLSLMRSTEGAIETRWQRARPPT